MSSASSEASGSLSIQPGSWLVERSRGAYLPELASSPDYASDQERPKAGSLLNVGGTGVSDDGTPTQEELERLATPLPMPSP